MTEEERRGLLGFLDKARRVTYGMATHDMTRQALRTRGSMEHLFILITMGEPGGIGPEVAVAAFLAAVGDDTEVRETARI